MQTPQDGKKRETVPRCVPASQTPSPLVVQAETALLQTAFSEKQTLFSHKLPASAGFRVHRRHRQCVKTHEPCSRRIKLPGTSEVLNKLLSPMIAQRKFLQDSIGNEIWSLIKNTTDTFYREIKLL